MGPVGVPAQCGAQALEQFLGSERLDQAADHARLHGLRPYALVGVGRHQDRRNRLAQCAELLVRSGLVPSVEHVTFFLGRENLIATERPGMAGWRVQLFSAMTRNSQPATKFFGIPPDRVMEIGAQIEL